MMKKEDSQFHCICDSSRFFPRGTVLCDITTDDASYCVRETESHQIFGLCDASVIHILKPRKFHHQVSMENRLGALNNKSHHMILVASFLVCSALLVVLMLYRNSMFDLIGGFSRAKVLQDKDQNVTGSQNDSGNDLAKPTRIPNDQLLDGLLAPGFDEMSCLSRYQTYLYHKTSPSMPSAYLISKLRAYEELHRRCGPYTEAYNSTVRRLNSEEKGGSECKYLVWLPANGLANRIISMVSSFLYALLTDRVLLVNHGDDMADLFCEPFPNTTWLLPSDFPLRYQFDSPELRRAHGLGTVLKKNYPVNTSAGSLPLFVHANLGGGGNYLDMNFYGNRSQAMLQSIPWLILVSDQYIAPSFFLIPSLKQEASRLFPEKDSVFHHLGHYLLNPSNEAWGLITRFYLTYLAKQDERIGLQIRVFNTTTTPSQVVMEQVLTCLQKEKLVPQVNEEVSVPSATRNLTSKSILIVSLYPEYYENISRMYWTKSTATGDLVAVYQPSHEGYQHFGDNKHNMKAWAEMYLLSLSDVLVTSGWSTFGYVAQGLAGLKAWILQKPENGASLNEQPCQRSMSMDPCFHFPPTFGRTHANVDASVLVPHVRHCEDKKRGLKLVNDHP